MSRHVAMNQSNLRKLKMFVFSSVSSIASLRVLRQSNIEEDQTGESGEAAPEDVYDLMREMAKDTVIHALPQNTEDREDTVVAGLTRICLSWHVHKNDPEKEGPFASVAQEVCTRENHDFMTHEQCTALVEKINHRQGNWEDVCPSLVPSERRMKESDKITPDIIHQQLIDSGYTEEELKELQWNRESWTPTMIYIQPKAAQAEEGTQLLQQKFGPPKARAGAGGAALSQWEKTLVGRDNAKPGEPGAGVTANVKSMLGDDTEAQVTSVFGWLSTSGAKVFGTPYLNMDGSEKPRGDLSWRSI